MWLQGVGREREKNVVIRGRRERESERCGHKRQGGRERETDVVIRGREGERQREMWL